MLKNFFSKASILVPLLILLTFPTGCGDTPFDEDYWDDPSVRDLPQEEVEDLNYSAEIFPLSTNVGNITGNVSVIVEGLSVTTTTQLNDVPFNLMIGEKVLSNFTCNEIATSYRPPFFVNPLNEFKTLSTTVISTRDVLNDEIARANRLRSGPVELLGKSIVIKGYANMESTPVPQNMALVPIACGTIQVSEPPSTVAGTAAGTVGTVVGGVNGTVGTVGGVAGAVAGTISGTIGTVGGINGSVAGAISGTIGTVAGGAISGTIGTVAGGAISGTIGTFTGGAISGTIGTVGGVNGINSGIAGVAGGTVSGAVRSTGDASGRRDGNTAGGTTGF